MMPGEEIRAATFKEEMIFWVDFNAVDRNNRLSALLRYAMGASKPAIGDWVWLMDGDGNGCMGRVAEISGGIVTVEPNWSTWDPPFRMKEVDWAGPGTHEGSAASQFGPAKIQV